MANKTKSVKANIAIMDGYGFNGIHKDIYFEDKCPVCGSDGLYTRRNNYFCDGEDYSTDNVYCKKGCSFKYKDLKIVDVFEAIKNANEIINKL